jgi:hypothetical protein
VLHGIESLSSAPIREFPLSVLLSLEDIVGAAALSVNRLSVLISAPHY